MGKALDYHASVKFERYKSKARKVAGILSKAPSISEVLSFGYPFYGKVNPSNKILRALLTERHLLKNERYLAKFQPDIDFILVFKTDETPRISKNWEKEFKNAFASETLAHEEKWSDISDKLEKQHNISFGENPVEEFAKGRVRLDKYPVPEKIWSKLHLLSTPEDRRILPTTTTLLLYAAYPLTAHGLHRVPEQFRRNYLLHMLRKAPASEGEILSSILAGHPRRYHVEEFPSAGSFFKRSWQKIFDDVKSKGLVRREGGKLALSKKGAEHVRNLSDERRKVLKSLSR